MKAERREQLIKTTVSMIKEVLNDMGNEIAPQVKTETAPKVKKETATPNKEIFEYIRERRSGRIQKVGIIWGTMDKKGIRIGWSKCNTKANDKFDLAYGIDLAKKRSLGMDQQTIPERNRQQMMDFLTRCIRYFKGAKTVYARL